jgi:hypothetical protein
LVIEAGSRGRFDQHLLALDGRQRVLPLLLHLHRLAIGMMRLRHHLIVEAVSRRFAHGFLVLDGRWRYDLRIMQNVIRGSGLDMGKYLSDGHRLCLDESRRIQLRLGGCDRGCGLELSLHGGLFVHGVEVEETVDVEVALVVLAGHGDSLERNTRPKKGGEAQ